MAIIHGTMKALRVDTVHALPIDIIEEAMDLTIEYEQEADGRSIAEVLELPGVLSYGSTRDIAIAHVADVIFALHDTEELGPRMLARLAKYTGLTPEDV